MTDFESLNPVEAMQSALDDLERRFEGMPAAQRAPLEADLQRLRSAFSQLVPGGALTQPNNKAAEKLSYQAMLLNNVHDAVIALDAQMKITLWNHQAEVLSGIPEAEALGKPFYEVVQRQNASREEREADRKRIERNGSLWTENTYITRTGQQVTLESVNIALRGPNGQISGYLITSRDITERRQTEQALSESQERLSSFLESTHDSFFALDENWRYIYANRRYGELMGRDPAGLIGKVFWEEFPHYLGTPIEQHYRRAMQQREPVHFEAAGVYIQKWFEVSVYPTQSGISVFATDRTDEHRAEADQSARAAELATIMNVTPAMIWIARDPLCRQMVGNRYGYEFLQVARGVNISKSAPELELNQQPYRNFKNGREIPSDELPMQVAAATGVGARNYDFDLVFNNGEVRTVLGNIEPLLGPDGQPTGAVAAFIDITERKQAEERTRRQNAILTGINRIFHEAITCQTSEELGRVCLAVAEEITGSKFGFIGEMNLESGLLEDIAISDPGWDACQMAIEPTGGQRLPIRFPIHGLYGRVLADAKSFYTNDPTSHPDHVGTPSGHPTLTAFLGAPLISGEKVIGMVGLGNREGGYRQEDLEALEALTPAIVQAILSKRAEMALKETLEALAESEQDLKETNQLFRVALSSLDMTVYMLDRSLRYTWIYKPNQQSGPEQILGRRYDELQHPNEATDQIMAALRSAIESGQGVQREVKAQVDGQWKHSLLTLEPIRDSAGQVSGLIGATLDITHQRQMEILHRETVTQMEIQRRLMEQREKDRQAIARDIHDGPVQTLSGAIFNLQFVKEIYTNPALLVELEQIGLNMKNAVQELRQVINELRPPSLIRFGLTKALQVHVSELRERYPHIQWSLKLSDDHNRLPEPVCLTLFRIYQEAVNNILRHSQASKAWITYRVMKNGVTLEIRDNGVGCPLGRSLDQLTQSGHFGLAGMKERAEAVGGSLSISSESGKGTTILVRLPEPKK